MTVFWAVRRVVWQKFNDVSEVFAALMMEAVSTSKTSVNFYQTTRRNNTEDSRLYVKTSFFLFIAHCGLRLANGRVMSFL
jgi:hypothetical protein